MRFRRVLVFALAAAVMVTTTAAVRARAQSNPFLGNWNITGDPPNTGNIYWLQVKDEGGTLSALFLNRGGSPVAAKDVKIANGELTFTMAGDNPKNVVSLKEAGGKLTGTVGETAHQGDRRAPADVGGVRRERRAHFREAGRPLRR